MVIVTILNSRQASECIITCPVFKFTPENVPSRTFQIIGAYALISYTKIGDMALKIFDERPSFMEFYDECCRKNLPCVLPASTSDFRRSRNEWVLEDGRPNLDLLRQNFGSADVCVTDCSDFSTKDMIFSDFIDADPQSLLYVKDWHFQIQYPQYIAYDTPLYFQSDWLNEYCDYKQNPIEKDYRFVYIGQKGTWTPFHADVFRSFSWSANICGRKLWYLVPPGEEYKFINSQKVSDLYGGSVDLRQYETEEHSQCVIKFVQNPGEIIFVPSNWYHQVHNLDFTISINHNWFNSANIEKVLLYMKRKLGDVKREIEHCKDLLDDVDGQYQVVMEEYSYQHPAKSNFDKKNQHRILKADVGINYAEFSDLLNFIQLKRLQELKDFDDENRCECSKDDHKLCHYCRKFVCEHDLSVCRKILKALHADTDFILMMNKI